MPLASRRRFFIQSAAVVWGAAGFSQRLLAQNGPLNPEQVAAQFIKPETQEAIDRGLTWIAARQNDDGAFGGSGSGQNCTHRGN